MEPMICVGPEVWCLAGDWCLFGWSARVSRVDAQIVDALAKTILGDGKPDRRVSEDRRPGYHGPRVRVGMVARISMISGR